MQQAEELSDQLPGSSYTIFRSSLMPRRMDTAAGQLFATDLAAIVIESLAAAVLRRRRLGETGVACRRIGTRIAHGGL